MSDILNLTNLKKIDLNCMLFFVLYMKYRKVSTVSNVLGCSDATVSIMLRRFGRYFKKPIFERKSRTLTPTDLALSLNIKCEEIINSSYEAFFVKNK
ncbi:hypothetical protein [Yokenella regensburgei]|uniref:hypothetical protein n=1 Tax=Yokenella regensburgei TaxID=158877 RepID=UPI001432FA16|nr:hypothetical protein [Yokenella regensburgei]QIU92587.1 hypothetical protein HEC60_25080 [Yokenella regensburgei]